MDFDLFNPLLLTDPEPTNPSVNNNNSSSSSSSSLPLNPSLLFALESDHGVCRSYTESVKGSNFNLWLRKEAISVVTKLCSTRCLDPFVSYLSVNYLDRFFSSSPAHGNEMPQAKQWFVGLVGLTCVSLAAKMMKKEVNVADFKCLEEEGFVFDDKTVERMEMVILGALNWRMRSITPFSFLNLFVSLFKFNDHPRRQALKARAVEIILKAQNEIKLLEFNPSVVGASAVLTACHELFPVQFPCFSNAVSTTTCPFLNKEKLAECCKVIVSMDGCHYEEDPVVLLRGDPTRSDTPVNVLDRQWSGLSCTSGLDLFEEEEKEEDNNRAAAAAADDFTAVERSDAKRRKTTVDGGGGGGGSYSSTSSVVQIPDQSNVT